MRRKLTDLLRDTVGAVVIETAFVAPVLVLMGIGAFEAGMIISRQVELQNAAAEASQIALASPPADSGERDTLKAIVKTSTGLGDANVAIAEKYRCGTDTLYVDDTSGCTAEYSKYVQISLTDTYTPVWAKIAFGSPFNYSVVRTVQIG
jgi:Flp pilus assembly protein TadG